jgi:accessory gene regulator protein AgrB
MMACAVYKEVCTCTFISQHTHFTVSYLMKNFKINALMLITTPEVAVVQIYTMAS